MSNVPDPRIRHLGFPAADAAEPESFTPPSIVPQNHYPASLHPPDRNSNRQHYVP